MGTLAQRLTRVERACRYWKLVGFALAAVLTLLAGTAAVREVDTVEAEQFVLRDAAGSMRAAWTMRPDKTPGLCLFDEQGKPRLSLDLAPGGAPRINLFNSEGSLRAAMAVRPDGTPGFCLADPGGNVRLSLELGRDGSTGLNLFGDRDALRAALAIRPDGTPALGLFDRRGNVQRSFELEANAAVDRRAEASPGATAEPPQHALALHRGG
jgi:hypothetical protein